MKDVRGVRGLWEYRAAGTIWRILPAAGRLIVGEERDTSAKTVSYFCVALDDGRVLWSGMRPAGEWWSGIEAVHRGIVFIHEYPVPSMPGHGKIFAIDLGTGAPAWENRELAFGFARDGAVYASREMFDRRQYFELDLRTGSVVREVPPEAFAELGHGPFPEWEMDVEIPVPAGDPRSGVRAVFPSGTELEPGESLSRGGAEVSNWYEVRPGDGGRRTLREHLLALDTASGVVLFHDVVCDGLSLPAGTSFFRAEERILYVRERTTLRSFILSTGDAS